MYIQITTRCNMECEHCCYSCTQEGDDMSIEVFKRCLEYEGEMISIGGGEPTVHPDFELFLITAIAKCEYVWLATNGKIKERAMLLSKLASKGVIACDLSQDEFHEEIDPEVVREFLQGKENRDKDRYSSNPIDDSRGIRDVTDKVMNAGRCDFGTEGCVCEDLFINPKGDIFACGCEDAPKLGNIMQSNEELEKVWNNLEHDCYKTQRRFKKTVNGED